MDKDQSNKNLQKASFQNEDLSNSNFSGSDLRGADFTGANLTGADFTRAKTGITPTNAGLLFLAALVVSLLSGYFAMLAGRTLQQMLDSQDVHIRTAAIIEIVLIVIFILFSWWKGVGNAIMKLVLPVAFIAILAGLVFYFTGAGTGKGMLYLVLAYFLVAIMFIVGTIARGAAGTLSSNILFIVVALGGGIFGKSIGGGIGTVIMALSCAIISKRALTGVKGFESLQKIASTITTKFGTSFRNSKLSDTRFTGAKIQNADFSNAEVSTVKWGDSKKVNCVFS